MSTIEQTGDCYKGNSQSQLHSASGRGKPEPAAARGKATSKEERQFMSKISLLEEMIEYERNRLDGAILAGEKFEVYYEQSRKLDSLIDEYYRLLQKE